MFPIGMLTATFLGTKWMINGTLEENWYYYFGLVGATLVIAEFMQMCGYIEKKLEENESDPVALCIDCGVDTFAIDEYYMVTDEIWKKAAPQDMQSPKDTHSSDYFLCIGCLEARLERKLVPEDFPMDLPINSKESHSIRLQQRMS